MVENKTVWNQACRKGCLGMNCVYKGWGKSQPISPPFGHKAGLPPSKKYLLVRQPLSLLQILAKDARDFLSRSWSLLKFGHIEISFWILPSRACTDDDFCRFSDISASFFLAVGQIVVEALVTSNLLFNFGYQSYWKVVYSQMICSNREKSRKLIAWQIKMGVSRD